MTLIAIWLENQTVWAAGDTQLSTNAGAGTAITEVGSKILPLSIRWGFPELGTEHDEDSDGAVALTFQNRTIGFAFAGRITPALMTKAFAEACLVNLMSESANAPGPSLGHCAELIRRIAEQFLRDSVEKFQDGHFDIAIFGMCPQTETMRAFTLKYERPADNEVKLTVSECDLASNEMILLGSHAAYREYFKIRVEEIRQEKLNEMKNDGLEGLLPIWPIMAPVEALKAIIDAGAIPGVGGSVQLAYVVHHELVLTADIKTSDTEAGGFARTFLGMSIDRLEPVGDLSISIPLA